MSQESLGNALINHQNGEKWHFSYFNCGMIDVVRLAALSISITADLLRFSHSDSCLDFNSAIVKMHPVSLILCTV